MHVIATCVSFVGVMSVKVFDLFSFLFFKLGGSFSYVEC